MTTKYYIISENIKTVIYKYFEIYYSFIKNINIELIYKRLSRLCFYYMANITFNTFWWQIANDRNRMMRWEGETDYRRRTIVEVAGETSIEISRSQSL